jgi:putative membrane protein
MVSISPTLEGTEIGQLTTNNSIRPLVLRFVKGAIHADIALPVILSALWASFIVYLDHVRDDHIGLPGSIISSLSIVVGLMLVFRNQTSYDRFWQVC